MNPSNSQRAPTPGAFSDVPQQGSRRGTPLPFHQTSASAPLYPVDPGTPVSSLALSRAGTPLPPLRSPAPSTPQPTVSPIPSGSHPPPVPAALNAPPQHISNPQAPAFVYGDNRLGSEALPDGGDLSNPDAWPSVAELIARLLDPPRQAFDYYHGKKGAICIKLSWVVKTIGEPHFMNNPAVSRSVLRPDSKLRIWG